MLTNALKSDVRNLLAECFINPRKQAARAARAQYIGELFAASLRGDDVDREAGQWLRRLVTLCGPHAEVADIARWYEIERNRLVARTGQ